MKENTIDNPAPWRADTPGADNVVHLNNAGAALMPLPVLDAIKDHLDLEAHIGGYEAAQVTRREWRAFYDAVGRLIGCPAGNIAWAASATEAYNKALSSIPFQQEDIVLTTRNDYASNQIAFLQMQARFGLRVVRAEDAPEGGVDPDSMRELVRKHHPRLVAVTHVPSSSGLVQPVEAIGKICREAGCLYLVDACQSVGQLDFDLADLPCDFLSATFRKFLRGPRGGGFLYVSDRILASEMAPLFLDLHSATWKGPETFEAKSSASRFETWEKPYALMQGARQAADYAMEVGLAEIERRASGLAGLLRRKLAAMDRVRVLDRGEKLGAIVSLCVEGIDEPARLHAALRSRKINTAFAYPHMALLDLEDKQAPWLLRVSPHYYNTETEIEDFLEALQEILQK